MRFTSSKHWIHTTVHLIIKKLWVPESKYIFPWSWKLFHLHYCCWYTAYISNALRATNQSTQAIFVWITHGHRLWLFTESMKLLIQFIKIRFLHSTSDLTVCGIEGSTAVWEDSGVPPNWESPVQPHPGASLWSSYRHDCVRGNLWVELRHIGVILSPRRNRSMLNWKFVFFALLPLRTWPI